MSDSSSSPPLYADIGKEANDIFSKGYGFGNVKLSLATKSESASGIRFKSTGTHNNDSGRVTGSFETKYENPTHGLTFTETWNTENVLGTTISVAGAYLPEKAKVALDTTFSPSTGRKTAQLKGSFKHQYFAVDCGAEFDYGGPSVFASAVLGYEGWQAGYQAAYDTSKGKVTTSNFALGYRSSDFVLSSFINDGQEFSGSLYHKVNDKIQIGAKMSWASGSNTTSFGVGAKLQLEGDDWSQKSGGSVSVKVNNRAQVGLGYTHPLRDGVRLTLSTLVDGKSLSQPGHKLGLGLEAEL